MTTCALEALGIVNALGIGTAAVHDGLIAAQCDSLVRRAGFLADRDVLVGAVEHELPPIPAELAYLRCRNNQLALLALSQVREAVERAIARHGPSRMGVVVATTTSGVPESGAAIRMHMASGEFPAEFHYAQLEHGSLATFLALTIGARGPAYTVSTACSSSAKALVSARALLDLGLCDAVLTGGVDALSQLTVRGFSALEAVAPDRSNPMSRNRRGLNLGEGAALFLVTRASGGIQLVGAGETSDHHHMSAPNPDGSGAESAMRAALADAQVQADEILYLNLHGTGTLLNDASESAAIARVFGERLPCSSTKPRVGHTLGAAGATEIAFCSMVLAREQHGELVLPPHTWDGERDPALAPIHLVQLGERARVRGRSLAMSNAFGFGGNNCVVILEQVQA